MTLYIGSIQHTDLSCQKQIILDVINACLKFNQKRSKSIKNKNTPIFSISKVSINIYQIKQKLTTEKIIEIG